MMSVRPPAESSMLETIGFETADLLEARDLLAAVSPGPPSGS